MEDPHAQAILQLTTDLPFFDMSTYVHRERPGLHHRPVALWSGWWSDHFRRAAVEEGPRGSSDPTRGPDLVFLIDGTRIGLLGIENASRRFEDRLDALEAHSREGDGDAPIFCVLWMWASCVEKPDVDDPDEYDARHPFYIFDKTAPDGLPLLERTREHARKVSKDSGMVWILAARRWKKGKGRGCKGLDFYVIYRGKDYCSIPRFVDSPETLSEPRMGTGPESLNNVPPNRDAVEN